MSLAAERAHEERFLRHLEECKRDIVVGAKVYRAAWDRIEEGVVRRVSKCRFRSTWGGGDFVEDETGDHDFYVAQFGGDASGHGGEWVEQTYQWRWFIDVEKAKKELVRQLRSRIEVKRHDIERLEAIIATMEPAPPNSAAGSESR